MNPSIRTILGVALCVGSIVASGRSMADEIRYPGYLPSFPAPAPATGVGRGAAPGTWLGGDAGFLCPLDSERSFWTFTDVSIGPVGARNRLDSTNFKKSLAIGNTIAIATCADGRFSVDHHFRGSPDNPRAFFPDPNNPDNLAGGTRLWPRKARLIGGKLYVFAHQGGGSGDVYNTLIIRVSNPLESPDRWHFDYLTVGRFAAPKPGQSLPPAPIHFGNEVLEDLTGTYLYTYGVYASNAPGSGGYASKFRVTALRIPLGLVESMPAGGDLGPHAQYLTNRPGVWKAGLFDPADYYQVGIPAFNGFTVRFNRTLGVWQCVYQHDRSKQDYIAGLGSASDPLVNSIYVKVASGPYGPWGPPVKVAEFPEMDPRHAHDPVHTYSADNYGYFVGERPAFEGSDREIVVTYSVWSYRAARYHDFGPIRVDMKQDSVEALEATNPLFFAR